MTRTLVHLLIEQDLRSIAKRLLEAAEVVSSDEPIDVGAFRRSVLKAANEAYACYDRLLLTPPHQLEDEP